MHEAVILVIGIMSILFGVLVIAKPKLLAYIVGFYFIVVGILAIIQFLL